MYRLKSRTIKSQRYGRKLKGGKVKSKFALEVVEKRGSSGKGSRGDKRNVIKYEQPMMAPYSQQRAAKIEAAEREELVHGENVKDCKPERHETKHCGPHEAGGRTKTDKAGEGQVWGLWGVQNWSGNCRVGGKTGWTNNVKGCRGQEPSRKDTHQQLYWKAYLAKETDRVQDKRASVETFEEPVKDNRTTEYAVEGALGKHAKTRIYFIGVGNLEIAPCRWKGRVVWLCSSEIGERQRETGGEVDYHVREVVREKVNGSKTPKPPSQIGWQKVPREMGGKEQYCINLLMIERSRWKKDRGTVTTLRTCQSLERMRELSTVARPQIEREQE
ncbi:hypothetical protein PHYBLDRAFT_62225 [Phycomyces blakesleeanus NRRL 1555(-)]|uniref:Uncharacterized protein n=1 Tax=Phycomyces blakesleeanus (strain ATCC 8743b / DSM 1359 / FGSC 10004 / NBRC 33097 / NRRL 1555) TaxID=763407 RepID=A0A167Q3E9_PHYB8|nr:hypothetical protein PHYBLDRAFT_62225 [Phycomyces blakesleeanus NRRL 1555(-)]OAD79006.1 hypothetical protein PHYBLDRAFT_62225 [Phycomyces blakesleeanus NRRL 1555(-)]|eukprot:XP_018297046.1 hypothetical protein PHYBLDRAFT_62225 [Phycomyces blakesleeanus NRRL 1555(-)]